MPLFGGEDTEACAFVVSEPHPYTSAESPYATPHKVSMPEECPMAENTFKILSAEGRSVRLLTARLKWCCTEQSKKARLISLVSKRHPAQKIITAGRKAYSQSNESCQVFGSISVQMLFQTFAALEDSASGRGQN